MTITWKIYIDFDRDGSFATANDEVTSYVIDAHWRIGMRNAFQLTSDEAELTMTLKNKDKRFSPENTGGTYYGKLKPQLPIKVDGIYNGSTLTFYRGWVDTFLPSWNVRGELVCMVPARGAKQFLHDTELYLELMQDVTADEVLAVIFEDVILPPITGSTWLLGLSGSSELGVTTYVTDVAGSSYDFEVGAYTFPYVGDSFADKTSAYDVIERLMRSERGHFYFDRSGTAVFLNRSHFQADYNTVGTVNDLMLQMDYDYGSDIKNMIRVNVSPRTISAGTVTLWSLEEAVRVDAGGTVTVRARYADDQGGMVAGYNVGTPTPTASSSSITLTSFTTTARSAECTFVNSGSAPGSVTALDITGQKITTWNRMEIEETDADSVSRYGRRPLDLDCDLLASEEAGRDVAQYELARLSSPRGMVRSLTLAERNSTAGSLMFNRTIADRIRVQETQTGHDAYYFVIGEEWRLSDGLKAYQVNWNLEPASTYAFWILEKTGYGELDSTTRLGF